MKKLIFSIAALAAIVVMGSCSQDSDLTNKTASSKTKQDSVTVSLNLNSSVEVSESSSSMTGSTTRAAKTIATRAGSTDASGNFVPSPDEGTTYTAYFVAAETGNGYTAGNIVFIKSVKIGDNSITVPNIKYNIYVTNYTTVASSKSAAKVGDKFADFYTPTSIYTDDGSSHEIPLPSTSIASLPANSSSLYLFGEATSVNFDYQNTTTNAEYLATATINLYTPYAAVCVKNNGYVNSVFYGNESNNTYSSDTNSTWYYTYILDEESSSTYANTTNSTINLKNALADGKTTTSLNKTLSKGAGYVYQYTVSPYGGLTVTISAFNGTVVSEDLDVTE